MNWKHQSKLGAFFILSMAFVALQYLGASTAFADFGFAPPPATDMSRSFLNQIFGSLLDGGSDAYGESIRNFNGAVLVIGGILAAYTIFAGTLGTAHDGEMLGKKFSSVWIPIRYVLGTALVLPVFSGGYCGMQVIVMWLIMQGVSVANGVWEEYMKNPPGLNALVSELPPTELLSLIENTYMAQVCAIAQKRLNSAGTGPAFAGYSKASTQYGSVLRTHPTKTGEKYWHIGTKGGAYTCGRVFYADTSVSNYNTSKTNTISQTSTGKTYDVPGFAELKNAFKTPDFSSLLTAHKSAIDDILIPQTEAVAEKYVGTFEANTIKPATIPDNAYDDIYSIATSYQTAIRTAAQAAINENTGDGSIATVSTSQGWFIAGAWATQIILAQNKLNVALNSYGTFSDLRFAAQNSRVSGPFAELAKPALNVIAARNPAAQSFIDKDQNKEKKDKESNGSEDSKSFGGDIAKMVSSLIVGLDLNGIKDDQRHPIIIMSTVGNAILNSILAGSALIFGIGVGAGLAGFFIDSVPAFITFYGTFGIPIAGFIGVGATLAYLIPNMPFLLWIGIIIGWSVMCIEAIIAAPLWAIMHLHPNGDDLTGRGGNGYMLVLGLLLRPVLIIFGLISAIILSGLFGQLINIVFVDTFTLNMGDGKLGFFSILFATGLYAALMMTVIKQCFQLMHAIPDQLMRWIGGGQEQLGQYAGASADSMTKASTIGAAAVGMVAEKGVGALQAGVANYQRQKEGQKAMEAAKQDGYMKAEEKYGAGTGASFSSIDAQDGSGGGSLSSQQQKSELGQMLGSMSPQQAASFNTSFNDPANANKSYPERRDAALKSSLTSQYGSSVADMVGKLSGGGGTGAPLGQQYGSNSLEVAKSLATVTSLKSKLDKTMDGASAAATLDNICTNADNTHRTSNSSISLKNAFKNEANKY